MHLQKRYSPLDKAFFWRTILAPSLMFDTDVVQLRPEHVTQLDSLLARHLKPTIRHFSRLFECLLSRHAERDGDKWIPQYAQIRAHTFQNFAERSHSTGYNLTFHDHKIGLRQKFTEIFS